MIEVRRVSVIEYLDDAGELIYRIDESEEHPAYVSTLGLLEIGRGLLLSSLIEGVYDEPNPRDD